MKVVILCGGEGTRLKELTEDIPKSLVEIGGKPILWHLMKYFSHFGHNDFILCLGYKGDKIKEYFQNNNENNFNIKFLDTGINNNKSERLIQVKEHIDDEEFFVSYGDDLCNVNLDNLLQHFKSNSKIAILTAVKLKSPFGIISINSDGVIEDFKEKPELEHWMNGGFFIFNRKIFNYLDKGDLEREVFESLAKEKQIIAFKHNGFWGSMNTLKDSLDLNRSWKENSAEWKIW